MVFDVEKKTQVWLGSLILVLSLVYVFASLGRIDWVLWVAVIFGLFLSVFLFIEGGIYDYWRRKAYKQISANDFLVWLTMFTSAVVLINTLALVPILQDKIPEVVLNFVRPIGITTGVIAGILGAIYVIVPKPKA